MLFKVDFERLLEKRPCGIGRIVGDSYKAQIDPAAQVTSQLAPYGLRGDRDAAGAGVWLPFKATPRTS
jgi:hypothetical protein